MKYGLTPKYWDDFAKLEDYERAQVLEARETVKLALQGNQQYYRYHKIHKLNPFDIWGGHVKDDLVFTFHYQYTDEGEKICWFRRVGSHKIYDNP